MNSNTAKTIASVAACLAGGAAAFVTNGQTGLGWMCVALIIIWNRM